MRETTEEVLHALGCRSVNRGHLERQVFYFCEWLRYRHVKGKALETLTISTDMANALD